MTETIGRRDLLKRGGKKAVGMAYQLATAKVALRPKAWIRPPFAVDELTFLQDCTRCDKCIEACPHDVIFALAERPEPRAAGTPAMDLLRHGCHMCDDWPCVAACEPEVLRLPQRETEQPIPKPKLATAKIDCEACLPYLGPECGACAESCPVPGDLTWEGGTRPVIDDDQCTGCALCREACIVDPKAIDIISAPFKAL